MDIGTAKPTMEQRRSVPHHMLDIVDASEPFSVARFQETARREVEDICARGSVAMLVGGTGLYFEAVVNDVVFPPGPPDEELRSELQQESARDLEGMKRRLAGIDPEFASGPGFENPRRIIRALEVYERTGKPFSAFQHGRFKQMPYYDYSGVVLSTPRQALYRAIERRVEEMFESGLLEEVRTLASGGGLSSTARQALGYKEVLDYLDSGIPLEDTINNIKRRSRNYAKRQLTWFRRIPGLLWIEMAEDELVGVSPRVTGAILEYLREGLSAGA